jgi:hypothetical protein
MNYTASFLISSWLLKVGILFNLKFFLPQHHFSLFWLHAESINSPTIDKKLCAIIRATMYISIQFANNDNNNDNNDYEIVGRSVAG